MSYGAKFGAAVALVAALTGCESERPSADEFKSAESSAQTTTSAAAAVMVTANDGMIKMIKVG